MDFPPFHMDRWLNRIEARRSGQGWDLASSTGPKFTLSELLALVGEPEALERLLALPLTYAAMEGGEELRAAIAQAEGVAADDVLVVTGAAEGLLILFALAAEPGANVVLPHPDFPAMTALAHGFGLEVRHYGLDRRSGFRLDPEAVAALSDARTRMILVISPHNPTGAVVGEAELGWLHDFCESRRMPLVCDQVYHPIYYGDARPSATRLPGAIVLGDCSKALCLSGLRVGWIVDRDAERREREADAKGYFTISNTALGEALAVRAVRHRDRILARARQVAATNLPALEDFFARHEDLLGWVRPEGGFTAFPWLQDGRDATALCTALDEHGVGVLPGATMDAPAHFRIGFGASGERFSGGLRAFDSFLENWPGTKRTLVPDPEMKRTRQPRAPTGGP